MSPLSLIIGLSFSNLTAQTRPGAPSGLLVELLRHPQNAVVTSAAPSFGWIVNDPRRGAMQSAYQIRVASERAHLEEVRADCWDSGRVTSSQSINVRYGGPPLHENSIYWWKVRTWDGSGMESPWSAPQPFNTGSFNRAGRSWPDES